MKKIYSRYINIARVLSIISNTDSITFVGTNCRGLKNSCMFVDIFSFVILLKFAYKPIENFAICRTFNFVVYLFPRDPRNLISNEE